MKTLSLVFLLMASMAFVLLGCSDNPASAVGPTSQPNPSSTLSKVVPRADGTTALQGFMRWDVYGRKEHKVIVDPMGMYTLCAAELNFTDKQNFVLHTKESFDNGDGTQTMFREILFKGTMTPSGQLKFTWPETWLEVSNWETMELEPSPFPNVVAQIRAHTGYNLSGPGINKNTVNFVGSFDGKKFFADCHTVGFQEEPGIMGPPYDVVVDGPIAFSMSIELQVSD
jgi:hypothetical protein